MTVRRIVVSWRSLPLVGLSILSGCSGDGESANDTVTALGYCDVAPIVADKCLRCHGEPLDHGAPLPLDRFESFHEKTGGGRAVHTSAHDQVESDIMPATWLTKVEPPVEPLTADEKSILLEWLGAGAPRGSGSCEGS